MAPGKIMNIQRTRLGLGPDQYGGNGGDRVADAGASSDLVAAAGNATTLLAPDGDAAVAPISAVDFRATRQAVTAAPAGGGTGRARGGLRYGVHRVLGRGGMGEVILAEDRDVGRRVAIKRVVSSDPGLEARFVDEVRMMAKLEHPNIASPYDVDEDADGRLFFTMRYVQGESLEAVIDRLRAGDRQTHIEFPLGRRLDIFEGLLIALAHAHSVGVLHRDIKPENVMLGPSREVVLTDWGISVGAGAHETTATPRARAGEVVGTLGYMSPEQARGDASIDARSDLYSAFVVLVELLTLAPYLPASDDVESALRHAATATPPGVFTAVWANTVGGQQPVPVEYRHYVVHGLANAREHRFTSAREALSALEGIRSGTIAIQCPVTLMKAAEVGLHRWLARGPMVRMAAVLAMVIGVVLVIGYLVS